MPTSVFYRQFERHAHAAHIFPDIRQTRRRKRNNLRPVPRPFAHNRFHLGEAHRAHFALSLREDEVRVQFVQSGGVDAVERRGLGLQMLDLTLNLRTARLCVDVRGGAYGQGEHLRRVIAFVGTPDQLISRAQGANHFGRGGQKGDNSFLSHFIAGINNRFHPKSKRGGLHPPRLSPNPNDKTLLRWRYVIRHPRTFSRSGVAEISSAAGMFELAVSSGIRMQ